MDMTVRSRFNYEVHTLKDKETETEGLNSWWRCELPHACCLDDHRYPNLMLP